MTSSAITKRTRADARVRTRQLATNPNTEIDRQIAALEKLDLPGIRWAWRDRTGSDAPEVVGRDLLLRALCYRLQAQVFGDLSRRLKHSLDRIADGDLSALVDDRSVGSNLKPGTELVREYNGETYRIIVQEDGYSWNGKGFASLSGAAKAITGSNWNGYVFFGLKVNKKASNG